MGGFKDSRIQDSRIQGFKIQGFKDSRFKIQGFKDSRFKDKIYKFGAYILVVSLIPVTHQCLYISHTNC
jgi:hypothetical protein